MVAVARDFFPRYANQYVPNMQYASNVVHHGTSRVSLGSPALADADGIASGVNTTATSGSVDLNDPDNATEGAIGFTADALYGRNVTFAGAGSGSKVITFVGRDYLGQPMRETITASSGSGTGKKAFKFVDRIILGSVAGGANTNLGWGSVLGLPYKCIAVSNEVTIDAATGEYTVSDPGTFVVADMRVATATTGDTRGTYVADATLDGATDISITAQFDNGAVSRDGVMVGGLHGVPQYNG